MLDSWLLFGHLVGVAALITGVGLEGFVVASSGRATTVAELRVVARAARLLPVLMPVSAVVLTVFGLVLVGRRSPYFSFGDAWVVASIGIIVVMGTLGAVVSDPRGKRFTAAASAAPDGPASAELRALATDPGLAAVGRIGGVATIEALWLMAVKPTASGTIVSLVIAIVLAAGAAMSTRRSAGAEGRTPEESAS